MPPKKKTNPGQVSSVNEKMLLKIAVDIIGQIVIITWTTKLEYCSKMTLNSNIPVNSLAVCSFDTILGRKERYPGDIAPVKIPNPAAKIFGFLWRKVYFCSLMKISSVVVAWEIRKNEAALAAIEIMIIKLSLPSQWTSVRRRGPN